MGRWIIIIGVWSGFIGGTLWADNPGNKTEFSTQSGNRAVRMITPGEENPGGNAGRKLPIRNPQILAQVMWVDRNHEFAIAENVTVTPDGSGIFAGWWLNNERFSAYSTPGLEIPVWTYREACDWQMPVGSSNTQFGGTSSGLPGYIWDKDSPLNRNRFDFEPGYNGRGVAFSGDGSMVAITSSIGSTDAYLLVYNVANDDTVFLRQFVPSDGQYGVDFSDDGTRVVVSNYHNLKVYSVPEGDLIGTIGNYSQNTAKISGDGSKIVIGTFYGWFQLFQWDGSQYSEGWSISTGHDWVTSVDISTDGSTAACGTLDFQGGQIAGGKFMMVDVASGDVLIDYDEYGDEVGSVALSADGQYAIAGSWGQYGYTFGDVVTCFLRGTDVPIFQLLDDIDEPGSIFSVAISDSGRYAAAGGKAVHAREFGNGGMLYSILIRDLLTYDVAVASIDEPGEFVNPGESVVPTATFINVGTATTGFAANCKVTNVDTGEEIYNSTYNVDNLPSLMTSTVYFSPDFTMPGEGRFKMEFTAAMESDEDYSNNTLSLVLRSWHDIKAIAAISPFNEVTVNWPLTGLGTFRNLGSYYETVDIEMTVYDSLDAPVYSTISTIYSLAPYSNEDVSFDPWIPEATGQYRVEFNALLADDFYPQDNSISKTFDVVDEMIYDDGLADVSIWVNAYPYSTNRKFAEKFAPNLAEPFNITNFRIFLGPASYNGYLDYAGIAKNTDNLPDTNSYMAFIENPALSGPGNWSSFDTDVIVSSNDPLWLVIHWPDANLSGPYIGADNTGVVEGNSYWYADDNGWNQYAFYDWMFRITLQQTTGTEFDYVTGLPGRIALMPNFPNPFNPSTTIEFALPNAGHTRIEIFNVSGSRVRTLADGDFDAGYHSVIWDGKTDSGKYAASGTYYYRLTAGDYRISRKMTLLK